MKPFMTVFVTTVWAMLLLFVCLPVAIAMALQPSAPRHIVQTLGG